MRKLGRAIVFTILLIVGLLFLGGALLAFEILSRERPRPVPSTTHASLPRSACLDCHSPIADEWRESYHYKSLTGPYWKDVRQLGYLDFLSREAGETQLGVECTPNIFRQPKGTIPAARSDDVELGVDCTACHVSRRGVAGTGRGQTTAHEVIADARFEVPALTVDTLCRTCHRATVEAWKRTKFAAGGVTCLDCHMPEVKAPSVTGGPERLRRSHRFLADKDPDMVSKAVNASLQVTASRKARFRMTNDRVGHDFPTGGNWVSVEFRAYNASGRVLTERTEAFGKDEALVLDFWPFNIDRRIAHEVFVKVGRSLGSLEDDSRLASWIYAITLNTVRDAVRARASRPREEESDDLFSNIPDSTTRTPEEEAVRNEMVACYLDYVKQLPHNYYEVYALSEFEHLSNAEIALQLSSPRETP